MENKVSMISLEDFEKFAFKTLPLNALDYYRSGANEQVTLKDNIEAFKRYCYLFILQIK